MSAHTLGRLTVRANGDANSYALLDYKGQWRMSLLLNGQQMTEAQQENMRRLAACWNACEGMPTDDIEELAACNGVMVLTVYTDDLREQLVAARALLAEFATVKFGADYVALQQRVSQFLKAPA